MRRVIAIFGAVLMLGVAALPAGAAEITYETDIEGGTLDVAGRLEGHGRYFLDVEALRGSFTEGDRVRKFAGVLVFFSLVDRPSGHAIYCSRFVRAPVDVEPSLRGVAVSMKMRGRCEVYEGIGGAIDGLGRHVDGELVPFRAQLRVRWTGSGRVSHSRYSESTEGYRCSSRASVREASTTGSFRIRVAALGLTATVPLDAVPGERRVERAPLIQHIRSRCQER